MAATVTRHQSESGASTTSEQQTLFWGCFIALITTAFAFVGRLFLLGEWTQQFNLDPAQAGRLAGIGIWPFAVSIIGFSLIIDKIGYKTAMYFAFVGHLVWTVMGVSAFYVDDPQTGYQLLYWGSLICALANGTVEAFINPVVATMFNREKTKWLNILHAGWPGGLVITGLLLIGIDTFARGTPWAVKIGLIAIPTITYFLLLVGRHFPESERVSAGVSYREMLAEFGVGGAAIVAVLIVLQLMDFFSTGGELSNGAKVGFIAFGLAMVVAFGVYTKSIGNPFLLFMILIMMPLATTEIGTDGWITAIMEGIADRQGFHAGWILVYTSAIMLVLRFFAGPIVHAVSPLGLLAGSAVLAIIGLSYLSMAAGISIFLAATLYGFGKTFFWPTMLGVVSEQCPKGGALTLNAISGIGMLAVGTLGTAYIGTLQTKAEQTAIVQSREVQEAVPGLVVDGKVVPVEEKSIYEVLSYTAIDDKKLASMIGDDGSKELATQLKDLKASDAPAAEIEQVEERLAETPSAKVALVRSESKQRALLDMAAFPVFMLTCYIVLIVYFRSKGGYKPVDLGARDNRHDVREDKYTGAVEAPMP
jgi:MFS family permease